MRAYRRWNDYAPKYSAELELERHVKNAAASREGRRT
jgi:hypothetical protein